MKRMRPSGFCLPMPCRTNVRNVSDVTESQFTADTGTWVSTPSIGRSTCSWCFWRYVESRRSAGSTSSATTRRVMVHVGLRSIHAISVENTGVGWLRSPTTTRMRNVWPLSERASSMASAMLTSTCGPAGRWGSHR